MISLQRGNRRAGKDRGRRAAPIPAALRPTTPPTSSSRRSAATAASERDRAAGPARPAAGHHRPLPALRRPRCPPSSATTARWCAKWRRAGQVRRTAPEADDGAAVAEPGVRAEGRALHADRAAGAAAEADAPEPAGDPGRRPAAGAGRRRRPWCCSRPWTTACAAAASHGPAGRAAAGRDSLGGAARGQRQARRKVRLRFAAGAVGGAVAGCCWYTCCSSRSTCCGPSCCDGSAADGTNPEWNGSNGHWNWRRPSASRCCGQTPSRLSARRTASAAAPAALTRARSQRAAERSRAARGAPAAAGNERAGVAQLQDAAHPGAAADAVSTAGTRSP